MAKIHSLLEAIAGADDFLLNKLLFALSNRHKQLHPDWELVILPLPVDPALREKHIKDHLPFLRCALHLDCENQPPL